MNTFLLSLLVSIVILIAGVSTITILELCIDGYQDDKYENGVLKYKHHAKSSSPIPCN